MPLRPKAVIFSHLNDLKYGDSEDEFQKNQKALTDKYTRIIEQYLACKEIAIVYVYIDWAVKKAIDRNELKPTPDRGEFTDSLIPSEQALRDVITSAEESARHLLKLGSHEPPRIISVGLRDILGLLGRLVAVDPRLTSFLHGQRDDNHRLFGYDSPKFVESVIRLARGYTPHLAYQPIIRIDEDSEINAEAIRRLIDSYVKINTDVAHARAIYYFSGGYGSPDGYDSVNDHAVRTHWIADPELTNEQLNSASRNPDQMFEEDMRHIENEISNRRDLVNINLPNASYYSLSPNLNKIKIFLADLSELGATQILRSHPHQSDSMREILAELDEHNAPKRLPRPTRNETQVISGAGLIMSTRAIDFLPPFMNFGSMTTWVDDHIKRRLHEVLNDFTPSDIENDGHIRFKQDRHPDGVTAKDIYWATKEYFDRLLRGCLFDRVISNLDGTSTEYSKLIRQIIRFQVVDELTAFERLRTDEIRAHACERYDEVLRCWQSSEFSDYAHYSWAKAKSSETNSPNHKSIVCDKVVEDARAYIVLLLKWPIFTRAIMHLPFAGHRWLFESVE